MYIIPSQNKITYVGHLKNNNNNKICLYYLMYIRRDADHAVVWGNRKKNEENVGD